MNRQPLNDKPSSEAQDIIVWDILVRVCHWGIVMAFVINYFLVEPGRLIHEISGYTAATLIIIRLYWGFSRAKTSYASFKHIDFSKSAFKTHIAHLKQGQIDKKHGHNPFGWLMVCFVITLLLGLGITGFMMEEIDALFGNSALEWAHSIMADALYAGVIVHVIAVFWVQHKGRIQLIRPMITGKRR